MNGPPHSSRGSQETENRRRDHEHENHEGDEDSGLRNSYDSDIHDQNVLMQEKDALIFQLQQQLKEHEAAALAHRSPVRYSQSRGHAGEHERRGKRNNVEHVVRKDVRDRQRRRYNRVLEEGSSSSRVRTKRQSGMAFGLERDEVTEGGDGQQ